MNLDEFILKHKKGVLTIIFMLISTIPRSVFCPVTTIKGTTYCHGFPLPFCIQERCLSVMVDGWVILFIADILIWFFVAFLVFKIYDKIKTIKSQ